MNRPRGSNHQGGRTSVFEAIIPAVSVMTPVNSSISRSSEKGLLQPATTKHPSKITNSSFFNIGLTDCACTRVIITANLCASARACRQKSGFQKWSCALPARNRLAAVLYATSRAGYLHLRCNQYNIESILPENCLFHCRG